MRSMSCAAFLACFSSALCAQHVLLEEAFNGGIPATWTNIHNSTHLDPWHPGSGAVDGTGDAHHEFFCTNGFTMRDNVLLSPVVDLGGVTAAFLEFGQHQQFPASRLYNAVVVTTDGGQSFQVVYQETGTWSGFGFVKIDLSAFAGNANVQVGFHYRGTVANGWSIDNVRITTSPLEHVVTNLVAGQNTTYGVRGAGAGNPVAVWISFSGATPFGTPWGNINLVPPLIALPTLTAAPDGSASVTFPVPLGTAGIVVHSQAIEFQAPATVRIANSMAPAIQ